MDSAEQLQRLYLAGFELQTFERFPKCVGVIRNECIALVVPGVEGLQILGTAGWRMGEAIGVLTEIQGRKVFQAKTEVVEATAERMAALERFREDLNLILRPGVPSPKQTSRISSEHVKGLLDDELE